jgi:glutamate synthase domain-containing protein 3
MTEQADKKELRGMIEKHLAYTGSERARNILENWETALPHFVKVFPTEYKRVLKKMSEADEATKREEVVRD